ncbi:alpha/beta hydrolase [Phycicoccus sp. CSK15P-2]|uniref:alpha/beta hydrolase n=1 Tax=Phycicoccus sp. CSK15P-2 TaxID=2807627 RepID=UPI00194FA3A6|nr:alpha/beta hydrolase [Phycicoccus sp. CSK15P-2]MBM6405777.1 alpha/beta hydrolase [Phycicoccus sp. CSK15P-2]
MSRRTFRPHYWALAQLGSRIRYTPPIARRLTQGELFDESVIQIPTRRGHVRAVVVRPPRIDPVRAAPPVVVHLHGGGFLNRYPEQDIHLARYLCAQLRAVMVLPDYSTAPAVRYPLAEEQMYDAATWVQDSGVEHGWGGTRLFLSGISAGAKLAINICQQIRDHGGRPPTAASLIVPVTHMTRTDRTSPAARPAINPFVQRLVAWAYFPDEERRAEPLAAPRNDTHLAAAMPPTIIQTAALDTLAPEGRELAETLSAAGVTTAFTERPDSDHGYYSSKPADRVRTMLDDVVDFFSSRVRDGQP